MESPFLLELTNLDPVDPVKSKSTLLLSMPSRGAWDPEEQEAEEVEEDLLVMMGLMKELPTRSPMATTFRIWSPSPRPTILRPWDHFLESLTEIGPEPKPFSLSSSDASCSTKELQDSSPLFNKLH